MTVVFPGGAAVGAYGWKACNHGGFQDYSNYICRGLLSRRRICRALIYARHEDRKLEQKLTYQFSVNSINGA